MPKKFSRGWLLAGMLACINALPARQEKRESNYGFSGNIDDLLAAAAKDYDFEDFSPGKYVKKVQESNIELPDLKAISTTTARNNNYVVFSRILEPDAEMLPAHYTGVEPPGVDHMEVTMMDSVSLGSDRKNNLVDGPKSGGFKNSAGAAVASVGEASQGAKGEKGFQGKTSFETGVKGEKLKERQRGQYVDAAGKKKSRDETEKHFKGREDGTTGSKSESYDIEGHRKKGHNAAGYHNVYHKDEYKKDADFYDNDHQGGRFQEHGHYDEKHTATEGDFRKGDSQNSAFVETEAEKKGQFEKGRTSDEASGHAAKSGYGGFFGKLDEFAKNIGSVVGQAFGKGEVSAKV